MALMSSFAEVSTLAYGGAAVANEQLASYSDISYRVALAFYAVAMVAFMAFYARYKVNSDTQVPQPAAAGSTVEVLHSPVVEGLSSAKESTPVGSTPSERIGTLFVWMAFLAHLASLMLRGWSAQRVPWGNMYEFISLTCLLGVIAALWFLRATRWKVLWPFVLLPVFMLLFLAGTTLYADSGPVLPALRSFWLPVHVSIVSAGAGLFLVSGVASLLFIVSSMAAELPDDKKDSLLARLAAPLPGSDSLDRLAYRTAIIGFPIFAVGIITGAIWAESAWGRYWGWDPKETVAFINWVVYAGYLHARATSGWKARPAAWVNVIGFVVMIFNLFFINLVIAGLHSYAGLN